MKQHGNKKHTLQPSLCVHFQFDLKKTSQSPNLKTKNFCLSHTALLSKHGNTHL